VNFTATFPLNVESALDRSANRDAGSKQKKVLTEPMNYGRQSAHRVAATETLS
jgi:hypothetical protein